MPYEDYTAYDINPDPLVHASIVDGQTITWDDMAEGDYTRISDDRGANAIQDFVAWVDAKVGSDWDHGSRPNIFLVSTVDLNAWNAHPTLSVRFAMYTTGHLITMQSYNGWHNDTCTGVATDTWYYFAISKNGTSAVCQIYSTAALRLAGGAGDVDTLSFTMDNDDQFQYLYALASMSAGGDTTDGEVRNLIFCEAVPDAPGNTVTLIGDTACLVESDPFSGDGTHTGTKFKITTAADVLVEETDWLTGAGLLQATFTGLSGSTSYKAYVQHKNQFGASGYGAATAFTTKSADDMKERRRWRYAESANGAIDIILPDAFQEP